MTAGILESGRPLAFTHPIVRAGLYAELSSAERAQGHLRAARLLAEQPGARERVAKHLLASEPAGDDWVVERLVEAARAAARNGAPESAAMFLRRALAEPPPPADQSVLAARARQWPRRARGSTAGPSTCSVPSKPRPTPSRQPQRPGCWPARSTASQRFAEAVEVLDRAASALDPQDERARAAARGGGRRRRDERPAGVADRRTPPRARYATARSAIPQCHLSPRRRRLDLDLDERAGRGRRRAWQTGRCWPARAASRRPRFRQDGALAALGRAVRPGAAAARCLDCAGPRRPATAAGSPSAWRTRGWLALRRGDLIAAEGDARTALAATELPAPPIYRVLNGGVLVGAHVDAG